mgnify:CR=1 FL=1
MDILAELYKKFNVTPLTTPAWQIFRHLSAFWQHFALHKRTCDRTGKTIISVFDADCPFPVWHKDEWMANANPPTAEYDFSKPFFEQLWELFHKCPIAHNIGTNNENCEYTDDWWYSKNCYLSHSGFENEDTYYCFRILGLKDCQFCVFSFKSELCTDLINSTGCFSTTFALNCRQCRNSAFLFDCRNCADCLFCWNLRNKQYCIMNTQYTKEEYELERAKYNFSSRAHYDRARSTFYDILKTKVWWRATFEEQCENCLGDQIEKCKNCANCFMLELSEDCGNFLRGYHSRDCLNTLSSFESELCYFSSLAQDRCYEIRFCHDVVQCRYMEYSMHCFKCEYCFACSGLVGKKYCILNKEYTPEEWHRRVAELKAHMKKEKDTAGAVIYGQFFPGHFAVISYDESLAGFFWPLGVEQQKELGFRVKVRSEEPHDGYSSPSEIPNSAFDADESICKKNFWDETMKKPFRITPFDLQFARKNRVPLPNSYYIRRIKENFSLIFFNGTLRETTCALTGEKIMTAIPQAFDGRIVSKEAYEKQVI